MGEDDIWGVALAFGWWQWITGWLVLGISQVCYSGVLLLMQVWLTV